MHALNLKRAGLPALISAVALTILIAAVAAPGTGAREGAPAAHRELECGTCHAPRAEAVTAAAGRIAPARRSCRACHVLADRTDATATNFHDDDGRDCRDCHSFHEPARLRAGEVEFVYAYRDEDLREQCASCHGQDGDLALLSPGHREAGRSLYHVDAYRLARLSPSDGCLRCHDSGGEAAGEGGAPAFAGHQGHPLGVTVPLGRGTPGNHIRRSLDPRIPLYSDRIECQTCHLMGDERPDLLGRFAESYDLCLGCHEQPFRPRAGDLRLASVR